MWSLLIVGDVLFLHVIDFFFTVTQRVGGINTVLNCTGLPGSLRCRERMVINRF